MSLYLGDQLISGINTASQGRVIGQIIQSTIPLNDAGLHLADGSTLNGEGVYKDFYEYMLNGNENAIKFRGSLTNNSGVVSGFSSYNCLQLSGPTARVDNSEYVVKFTTGSDITTSQAIIASEHWICLDIGNTSGKLSTWNWETGSTVVLNSVSANTTYWVKIVCSGTSRTFSISTNGTSYTQMTTYTDTSLNSTTMNEDYDFILGRYSHAEEHPFLGSIDLTGSYIKQNNEFIWDGSNYSILPNQFNTKRNYQWFINTYGVCGQYILDPTNKTITLPRITGILEGVVQSSESNHVVDAGLPNITGSFVRNVTTVPLSNATSFSTSGALGMSSGTTSQAYSTTSSSATRATGITFNASNSNSIYGNSTTVQPQTVTVYYYIVLSTLTKTDIETDIDNVVTDLNNKADKDFSNCEAQDKINLAIFGFPSSHNIALTLGSSGTVYTMSDNGWLYISKPASSANQYINFSVHDASDNYSYDMAGVSPTSSGTVKLLAPVKKGWKVTITYSLAGSGTTYFFLVKSGA